MYVHVMKKLWGLQKIESGNANSLPKQEASQDS